MADDRPREPLPRLDTASGASAVVPVQPDDQLDAVASRVRAAGVAKVQLLIPGGAAVFRSPRSFLALRALLADSSPQLLVVSGDARTIDAARSAGIDILGIDAAALAPPRAAGMPSQSALQPIDARDAAFLRDLDEVGAQEAAAAAPEGELYASLEDLYVDADQYPGAAPQAPTSDEDFAAELERLSSARREPPPARPLPEEAMRRLSGETLPGETRPRRSTRPDRAVSAVPAERVDPPARPERSRAALGRPAVDSAPAAALPSSRRGRGEPYRAGDYEPAARRSGVSPNTIALLVVVGLLVAGALWALTSRVTVLVSPPAGDVRQIAFDQEVIPLDQGAGGPNATAVQAVTVSTDAEYTLTSQVTAETISPVGRAAGQVRIINTIEQAVPLLEGTEFVGQNAEGAEVRFVIDQPTQVPPAVTSASDTGRSTTYGEIVVAVTARSPGSASNVGPNAIKQIVIPGQQPIVTDRSNFLIRHDAIGGGTEEPQRIVTEAEVQRVLSEALTNLYNTGLQQLQAQVAPQGLTADPTTVTPSVAELARPESYEPPVVEPPIGSAVDPANPNFSVTIRTRFTALATPTDQPVAEQLETVVPQHFSQRSSPPCAAGETQAVRNVSWSWSGERLTIDGVIECTPRREVSPETIALVRAALVGQSREAAEASLREYERQQLIGGFQLPDRDELPPFELLIDVQVAPPSGGS
jgi:hypothetical protein